MTRTIMALAAINLALALAQLREELPYRGRIESVTILNALLQVGIIVLAWYQG